MVVPRLPWILTGALLAGLALHGCGGGGDARSAAPPPPPTFSLTGTVQPAAGSALDGDVNDPRAPLLPNDSPAAAQQLLNPVTLGGYVNDPGAGPPGRSFQTGDPEDWYRVHLIAGQTVTLFIAADGRIDDLDLFLTDLDGRVLDASVGQSRTESLTVAATGDYLLSVQTFRDALPQRPLGVASGYVLTIGWQPGPATAARRLSDPLVPGQMLAAYDAKVRQGRDLEERLQPLGLSSRAGDPQRLLLLHLADRDRAPAALSGRRTPLGGAALADAAQRHRLDTLAAAKALALDPLVRYAEPNLIAHPSFVPDDPEFPRQWHYSLLRLPQAWDLGTGRRSDGLPAIVAVLDSGIRPDHPDLQGQLVAGYDFVSDPLQSHDGDGIDPDPTDPGDPNDPDGSVFHGTHVAGTVAAATGNGVGVAGVAFNARIMPVRVLAAFGTYFDIIQGIRFAAGLSNDSGTVPARRADVINMSLGGRGQSLALQEALDAARAAGVVVVAAAGNESGNGISYPAAANGVIGVSALTLARDLAAYSNFGFYVDAAAPGGDQSRDLDGDGNPDGVFSTGAAATPAGIDNRFVYLQGTSMATPHVAGVVALMRAANPALSPAAIDALLASGTITQDLGEPGRDDTFGHGLIDAFAAVGEALQAAGGAPPAPAPALEVSPPGLNFGLDRDRLEITVTGSGGAALEGPPAHDAGAWLSVAPLATNAGGLGRWRVTVDRSLLADGVHTATVSFPFQGGAVRLPLIVQVSGQLAVATAGPHSVLLVNAADGAVVQTVAAAALPGGGYGYRFEGVAAGDYRIVAGSDLDHDGAVCSAADACGAWQVLGQPGVLAVDRELTGLDFGSGFAPQLPVPDGEE